MLFCFTINLYATENTTVNTLKDLDRILKQDKYNRLVKIDSGKLEIDQVPDRVYMFSTEKYYINIAYSSTQIRNLSDKSKKFMKRWLSARYIDDSLNNKQDMKMVLVSNQVDIFFKEMTVVDGGKLYNFIIQTPLVSKLKNITSGTQLQAEVMYLGKNQESGSNFFLMTNFSTATTGNKVVKESDFITAKRMIYSEQYLAAIQKLTTFIKQYPDNLEARKNVCLAEYLYSLKANNKKYTDASIKCYEDLVKVYEDGEIYYTLAAINYSSDNANQNLKYNNVLKYADKAVNLLSNSSNSGSNRLMYCGSLYFRGMAKLNLKNTDGLNDIETVQNQCPEFAAISIFGGQKY